MLAPLKRAAWHVMRAARLDGLYCLASDSPLAADGWFRSFREGRAVDRDGNPVPWLTYPAIEFLSRRVRPEMTVFEYGSGASTAWWAARVGSVHAVEHDRAWYERTSAILPANARVDHVPVDSESYPRSVLDTGMRFDIVVIDGRRRVECVAPAMSALTERGVIVFDNTEREQYRVGIQMAAEQRFRRIEFVGMVPIVTTKNETSILYRQANCLGI